MGTMFQSNRIGHFALDTSQLLIHRELYPVGRGRDLLWFPEPAANRQWDAMVRRHLTVRWWAKYLDACNRVIPGGDAHRLPYCHNSPVGGRDGSRDIHGLFQRSSRRLELAPAEDEEAKRWLRSRGWRDGEPFVCLLVRDSAYMSGSDGPDSPWSYHDHRDTGIGSYAPAVRALLDRGYWVVRMGKVMNDRLPVRHPKAIDYPFADDQSDVVDVWLAANCRFFVSTGTGLDVVAVIYGRPVLFVNYIPLAYLMSFAATVTVPKPLVTKDTGRPLTLREYLEHAYLRKDQYDQAGIRVTDLSDTEILDAVSEIERHADGTWTDDDAGIARQRRFWEVLRSWRDFDRHHHVIHPNARVGSAWLKSTGDGFLA